MTRILEVNEEGALVIPADLLNGAEPHQRYRAESAGKTLVLEPESALPAKLDPDEWWRQWNALSEQIGRQWKTDKSAAEIISEMRR